MNKVQQIYNKLLKDYGKQGWWPLLDYKGNNPTKTGSLTGYHPGDYSFPKTDNQVFEICIGAILTQNVGWINVEKALRNLKELKAINPENLLNLDEERLKEAIRPAGYFNQKAKKLKEFTKFYIELKGKTPKREELLDIWGVGKETADSMLLYAFEIPVFVVDAYTRRIFSNLKLIDENDDYDKIREFFESNLKKDIRIYQEFHALIVEHAKRYYSKKSDYNKCPLLVL